MARGKKLGCFGLTEPDFGSNPGGMITRARKTSDGYRLSGAKKWIGNATIADVAIVWAKVDGEPGVDPDSSAAIRGFLVEKGTPGFNAPPDRGQTFAPRGPHGGDRRSTIARFRPMRSCPKAAACVHR